MDLATSSGEPGRWFAAAKDAGFLDLALEFASAGRTDPRTLSRASRDFLKKDARFCLEVGRLAILRIIEGYGYELTGIDVRRLRPKRGFPVFAATRQRGGLRDRSTRLWAQCPTVLV